jgi:hypothetical protein
MAGKNCQSCLLSDVNISELPSSESPKWQLFQKGDSVTYRINKGKRSAAVIAWTDGKQVKLIDNGTTVSKSAMTYILTFSSLESNLLN